MELDEIKKAIGENEENDYKLSPAKHIELYEKSLPFLSKLLKKSEIQYFADEYRRNDDEAIHAQGKFKKQSDRSRLFIFLTAAFSTGLIISGSLSNFVFINTYLHWLPSTALTFCTIATIVFSAISTATMMIIKNGKLFEKWMENRAEAEEIRLKYFKRIAEDKDLKKQEDYLQVLEYFRRYQLDVQVSYYSDKSIKLGRKAEKSIYIIAILSALFLIINGIAGMLGVQWASLASFAIIVQAYSFMITNKESGEQNTRNSEKYEKMRSELSYLRSQIDGIRKGILSGKKEVLFSYIKAVQDTLSGENQQWLKTMNAAASAMADLENYLKELKDPKKESEKEPVKELKIEAAKEPEAESEKELELTPEIEPEKEPLIEPVIEPVEVTVKDSEKESDSDKEKEITKG